MQPVLHNGHKMAVVVVLVVLVVVVAAVVVIVVVVVVVAVAAAVAVVLVVVAAVVDHHSGLNLGEVSGDNVLNGKESALAQEVRREHLQLAEQLDEVMRTRLVL